MKRDIQLYINGQEVDLAKDSLIQLTYTMDDLTEPAVVKNSYSQSVTLPGTARNNRILGHIAELTSNTAANGFNPLIRTPFILMYNGCEVLERGYIKLDNISHKGETVIYNITLYGGLGSFFYSLSFDEAGEKKSLASLDYLNGDKLDFRIYKEVVEEAWATLGTPYQAQSKWHTLNFAPAYNGLPDGDFSADKAMCNPTNANYPTTIVDSDGRTLTATNFISLSEEYTEWEVKDLRSYLQRPVIRMRALVEAMCNSEQNGGYKVNLDSTFFNDDNPIWADTWVALPILNTLEIPEDEGEVGVEWNETPLFLPTAERSVRYAENLEGATLNEVVISARLGIVGSFAGGSYRLTKDGSAVSATVTLTAYNKSGEVLGSTTQGNSLFNSVPTDNRAYSNDFSLELLNIVNMASLVLEVTIPEGATLVSLATSESVGFATAILYNNADSSYINYSGALSARTGALIAQDVLLATSHTPADYLISYAKMCGLHFLYDKVANEISIVTRNTLYGSAEKIDLTKRIDRGSNIKVLPYAIENKWYDYRSENEEGEFATYYKKIYGKVYGEQVVNTGYDFNAEHTDVMESVIFGGVAEVRERSRYYNRITQPINEVETRIPSVFLDAGHSVLYKLAQLEQEEDVPTARSYATIDYLDATYKSYYPLAMAQFHSEDNSPIDANNALLFFTGKVSAYVTLTDDTAEMMRYNENEPCWILNESATPREIPHFSRYMGAYSLDWGTPQEVDNPTFDVEVDWRTLYGNYWRAYTQDRFTSDTRVVTAKVDLRQMQVGEALLRNFYYFDNVVWTLNKISNHSVTTEALTECEFVRVIDIDNYTNGQNI